MQVIVHFSADGTAANGPEMQIVKTVFKGSL